MALPTSSDNQNAMRKMATMMDTVAVHVHRVEPFGDNQIVFLVAIAAVQVHSPPIHSYR